MNRKLVVLTFVFILSFFPTLTLLADKEVEGREDAQQSSQGEASSELPSSGLEERDGIITVRVYIDPVRENIEQRLVSGTALLRTRAYLMKKFRNLDRCFSVRTRVIKRGYDADNRIFSYITEYTREDLESAVQRAVERAKQAEEVRIRKEKMIAEQKKQKSEKVRIEEENRIRAEKEVAERERIFQAEKKKKQEQERLLKEREQASIAKEAEESRKQEDERQRQVKNAIQHDFEDGDVDNSVVISDSAEILNGGTDNSENTSNEIDSESLFK